MDDDFVAALCRRCEIITTDKETLVVMNEQDYSFALSSSYLTKGIIDILEVKTNSIIFYSDKKDT